MKVIDKIHHHLEVVEQSFGVKILLAVESGSRVWGFESPDSDYDVRFIYLRPPSWYLGVRERRDVIELPLLEGIYDISGWDLKKALELMGKSNPPLFEWLSSPITYIDSALAEGLRAIGGKHFNHRSAIYHYLHMANGNYRTYLRTDMVRLKKYIYVLRPLLACMWIEKHGGVPPVTFDELRTIADWGTSREHMVSCLIDRKREGTEMGEGAKLTLLNDWIEIKLEYFAAAARTTAKNKNDIDDLDDFLFTSLYPQLVNK